MTPSARPGATPVPDAAALLFDPQGFGLDQYCGVFLLPGTPGAVIETAASPTAERVLRAIDAAGMARADVRYVFATHIHLDHVGAAWRLLQELPRASLVVHKEGAPYLTQKEKTEKLLASVERAVGERFPLYGTFEPVPAERVVAVTGGETFDVAGRRLEVLDAPGHAPHHYVLHDPQKRVFYAGDALGIRTPNGPLLMTTPPPRFDLARWNNTLARLDALDARWALLTHFGWVRASDQIAHFRRTLGHWVEEVTACRDAGMAEEEAVRALSAKHTEARAVYDEAGFAEEMHMNVRGVWLWLERGA